MTGASLAVSVVSSSCFFSLLCCSFQLEEAEGLYLSSLECSSAPAPHRLCTYADFLLAGKRQPAAAVACYETCLHLCPQHGEAAHNLALVLSRSDPARAARLFEISLKYCCDALAKAKAVRSAALFFEAVGDAERANALRKQSQNYQLLAQSGPLLYHATGNDLEFALIVSILGAGRKFKIAQLRVSVPVRNQPGASLEDMARAKAKVRRERERERERACACLFSFPLVFLFLSASC